MTDYDFHSLSTWDFQGLVRDLLQEELKLRLESFAKGPDGGTDFRFRTREGDSVVQCKHYGTDYNSLFRVLKRDEVSKVLKLKPRRYILAVSTPLTPHRKDQILGLFAPYCNSPSDIFGLEDLNNLLTRHEEIESKHFKLWLTSKEVLTRMLNAGVWGDTEITMERIRSRACRYVPNPSLNRAKQILDKYRYCIIAGIPGIGKTTLAEILLIDFADRHAFQPIRIANDLSEIKAVKDPNRRQIFYFDDFLGKTAIDKLQKNEDQRLMELLQDVAENKNWRFVLTTREYILNAAKLRYETLEHPPVPLEPCIVDLADYTYPIRARILYNHIFFSDLSDEHKRALLEGRHYQQILNHQNYNPRIVEHLTQRRNVSRIPPVKYVEKFLISLSNPMQVWDHAFRYQLSQAAQHVLLVMASLVDEVLVRDLEIAFNKLYQNRRAKFGFHASSRDFENALKELDGNFIKTSLIGSDQIVVLHNPSVSDYLESYLAASPNDVCDLLEGAAFFDQFLRLWRGRGGERFQAIDMNSRRFILALSREFGAPSCRLLRVGDGHGRVTGVQVWQSSFEARVLFAVEVSKAIETADSQALLVRLLDELRVRVESGQSHKDDLVRLLTALREGQPKLTIETSIVPAAKSFLASDLDSLDDFESISTFFSSFPEASTSEDVASVHVAFEAFCDSYDDYSDDDPDWLRYCADRIKKAGKILEVDTEYVCDHLKGRAQDLEDEARDAHPDSPEDEDDGWREHGGVSDDVGTMFEELLGEIDERSQ
jgi:hypothetical protein